jgi:hypothetical protein
MTYQLAWSIVFFMTQTIAQDNRIAYVMLPDRTRRVPGPRANWLVYHTRTLNAFSIEKFVHCHVVQTTYL